MNVKHIIPLVFTLGACGGEEGRLTLTTYGEEFIEQGIPAQAGADDEGLVDGYTVTFERFLVVFAEVRIADRDGRVAADSPEARVFDLAVPGPHPVHELDLPAGRWADVGVTVAPSATLAAGNASTEDVERMRSGGYSVFVEGRASGPGGTYRFAWPFSTRTRFEGCVDAEESPGVVVPTGGRVSAEITVHGDHFFYDQLQSEEPSLRFEAFAAADTDQDNEVTLEELAAVSLDTLPLDRYGTGGAPGVDDLRDYVTALTGSLVHFQGEGHCVQVRLP